MTERGFDDPVVPEPRGPETIEFEGETYEIVPPPAGEDLRKLTPEQSYAVGEIYRAISRMLPLEGRDYTMKAEFSDGSNSPSLSFRPMNELGVLWCTYLSKHLAGELARSNKG